MPTKPRRSKTSAVVVPIPSGPGIGVDVDEAALVQWLLPSHVVEVIA